MSLTRHGSDGDNGLMFALLSLGNGDDATQADFFDGSYPTENALKLCAERATLMFMLNKVGVNFAETQENRTKYDLISSNMFTFFNEYAQTNWAGTEGAKRLDDTVLFHVEQIKAKMSLSPNMTE